MKTKDTVSFRDLDGLIAYIGTMTADDGIALFHAVDRHLKTMPSGKYYSDTALCGIDEIVFCIAKELFAQPFPQYKELCEQSFAKTRAKHISTLKRYAEYSETEPIYCEKWTEDFAYLYMGNPEKGIIVPDPAKYLVLVQGKDYGDTSPAALRALSAANGVDNAHSIIQGDAAAMTPNSAAQTKNDLEKRMDDLRQELDDTKNANTGELAAMQAKIDAMMAEMEQKKEAMMAELNRKKAEMELQMEKLNMQIFLLDSEIYSILCYNGETVKFRKLCSGKSADATSPVIIFQKLRFLDEELGKLASLYTIDWDNLDMFENLLRHNPTARETFAPYERCVQLIRLSKTGTLQHRAYDQEGLPLNMLEDYEYYHGKTVGILIRNGENLYLGWTDDERVHIEDDLLVDFSKTTEIAEESKEKPSIWWTEEDVAKRRKAAAKKFADGYVSRQFIYNILQGVVDHSDILPLPDGVTLAQQSVYVVYSMAEAALEDNRFGSFGDIIAKCNSTLKQGDMLLTVQGLSPEYWNSRDQYRAWHNPRGRGSANRTHDASVADCELYPLNLIEYDEPRYNIHYRANNKHLTLGEFTASPSYENLAAKDDPNAIEMAADDGKVFHLKYRDDATPEKITSHIARHVYVSVEKSDGWYRSEKTPRANFEVYPSEFVNLAVMNSVWLKYAITTQKLSGWRVSGKEVLFSYAIRYLKTALDYVSKREETESALISAIDPDICADDNWSLALSEWKLETGVHNITAYQAKRFAKWYRSRNTR